MGMTTMRERAEALGGHLAVQSASGEGTRVCVEVSLSTQVV
jgi:signal transduction histidine kinase